MAALVPRLIIIINFMCLRIMISGNLLCGIMTKKEKAALILTWQFVVRRRYFLYWSTGNVKVADNIKNMSHKGRAKVARMTDVCFRYKDVKGRHATILRACLHGKRRNEICSL